MKSYALPSTVKRTPQDSSILLSLPFLCFLFKLCPYFIKELTSFSLLRPIPFLNHLINEIVCEQGWDELTHDINGQKKKKKEKSDFDIFLYKLV